MIFETVFSKDNTELHRHEFAHNEPGDYVAGVSAAIAEFRKLFPDVSLFDVTMLTQKQAG